jgi:hypothetical protein
VCGPDQMVEYLTAEVQIADFLCDDLQTWAGAECLYLCPVDIGFGGRPCH